MTARPFELLLFATDEGVVGAASAAGVDGIIVDWERADKARRQASADTEINQDTPADLRRGDALGPWLAPLAANFALLLVLGLTLPAPLVAALEQVLKVLGL